jgi:hypothetical protein
MTGAPVREIDPAARARAIHRFGLQPCLHVPIAARDRDAIEAYVGSVRRVLTRTARADALLVRAYGPSEMNPELKIWELAEASVLHRPDQVWVHVGCRGYRRAYARAFPGEDLTGRAIDHVMNRTVARLKGFAYVRIVPISPGANASSGALAEKWGVRYHGTPRMRKIDADDPARIQYADVADITKMLDRKTGGSLQDPVNEVMRLLDDG